MDLFTDGLFTFGPSLHQAQTINEDHFVSGCYYLGVKILLGLIFAEIGPRGVVGKISSMNVNL